MKPVQRKDELVSKIHRAFSEVVRPGDAELLHSECRDDMDVQWLYSQRGHWSSLSALSIETETATLCFLSPAGFAWVLPAYLCWSLNNYVDAKSTTPEDTISALCPHGELKEFMISKYACLTPEQSQAIREFLDFFNESAAEIPYRENFTYGLEYWAKATA